jgi:aminoglycoside phosphotransferase family enzyme/predicted kinase
MLFKNMQGIKSLTRPSAFGEETEKPSFIEFKETHISWIFFTGKSVYKVKKPVNYGFLDFSTLEKQRYFCQEELRLNQRLSPEIYQGIVEVKEKEGEYFFGGSGQTVGYAVKMSQLPKDRWLSTLLKSGEIAEAHIRQIARRIAEFHLRAESTEEITAIGGLSTVKRNLRENFEQTRPYLGITLSLETYDLIKAYSEVFVEEKSALFDQREKEGRIRDCHGDLHADQICILESDLIFFIDCIEFNKEFRYSDVAAEIAFTAMDLDYYRRSDLAHLFVEEYLESSKDFHLLQVLNFYKCYRAFTRGKVASFSLNQQDPQSPRYGILLKRAQEYFRLASAYASLKKPLLFLMTGFMGTGKSTLASALATRFQAEVLRSDVLRKELVGQHSESSHYEAWGKGLYSAEFTEKTYQILHQKAGEFLKQGKNVSLDASYRTLHHQEQALRLAQHTQASLFFIETICPEPLLRERLRLREEKEKGSRISDGRLELLPLQKQNFQESSFFSKQHLKIETSGSLEASVSQALQKIYQLGLSAGLENQQEDSVVSSAP